MTISTTASSSTFLGNGAETEFDFSFVVGSESNLEVTFTDTDGIQTILDSSQYTVSLNAPAAGQIWGVGGTVTYPTVGSPIAVGTSLTVARIEPLTQVITIANQGDFAPAVIEEALDTLAMQIQQVAARTGTFRGVWATDVDYNYADIVQDGENGTDSQNFYLCVIANTSDDWEDDLEAGYWSLFVTAAIPEASLPLTIPNGGTGAITAAAARTALGAAGLEDNNVFSGTNNFTGGITANGDTLVTRTGTMVVTNKTLTDVTMTISDTLFTVVDNAETTKGFRFECAAISTATTRTYTVPNANTTLVGTDATQSLTNKTITNSTLNNSSIGLFAPAAAVFTTVTVGTSVITSSSITATDFNGRIGDNTPAAGTFTNLTASQGAIDLDSGNNNITIETDNGAMLIRLTGAGTMDIQGDSTNNSNRLNGLWIGTFDPAPATFTSVSQSGNTIFSLAPSGITLKRGANGRVGTVTLTGTTAVTVNNTSIATSDLISFSLATVGGTVGTYPTIKTITASTGFTVAGSVGDTSTYNYHVQKSVI